MSEICSRRIDTYCFMIAENNVPVSNKLGNNKQQERQRNRPILP
jgi:hypothetical protein